MKKRLLHIILGIACFLVTSCTNYIEDGSLQPPETSEVQVTFTLAMGEPVAGSRVGTWEDNEGSDDVVLGSSYENQIDLNTLQVMVYSLSDGSYVGKVERIKYTRADAENNVYELLGELAVNEEQIVDGKLNCKMMVFANCPEVAGNTSLTGISGLFYQYNTKYIPMWGVKAYTNLELKEGGRADLGAISLLRALAKVEVKLSGTAAQNFSLRNVSLNKYNKQGYCLPTGYAGATDTKGLDTEGVFNVYASSEDGSLTFKEVGANDFIIYLPEYNPTTASELAMGISLYRKSGEAASVSDPHVYFKDYATNTPIEMVRNHHYLFNITDVTDNEGLTLDFLALPWEGVVEVDVPTFN